MKKPPSKARSNIEQNNFRFKNPILASFEL